MFSSFSALFTLAITIAATARMERHTHLRRDPLSQCDTGDVRCCNSVANATDIAALLNLLSMSYDPADSVGIDCTPINIYGLGQGATCQQQPVCCTNMNYSGFINVGCSPMNLN